MKLLYGQEKRDVTPVDFGITPFKRCFMLQLSLMIVLLCSCAFGQEFTVPSGWIVSCKVQFDDTLPELTGFGTEYHFQLFSLRLERHSTRYHQYYDSSCRSQFWWIRE